MDRLEIFSILSHYGSFVFLNMTYVYDYITAIIMILSSIRVDIPFYTVFKKNKKNQIKNIKSEKRQKAI